MSEAHKQNTYIGILGKLGGLQLGQALLLLLLLLRLLLLLAQILL